MFKYNDKKVLKPFATFSRMKKFDCLKKNVFIHGVRQFVLVYSKCLLSESSLATLISGFLGLAIYDIEFEGPKL